MIYHLSYNDTPIAKVEITDSSLSKTAIREMVEFWAGWESDLENAGDYTTCWLKKLAHYILVEGKVPKDEEGWYPLNGERHIWVRNVWAYDFDKDAIKIEEEST
jgi:hypothetical protein